MPDSLPDVPSEMLEQLGDAVEGVTPATPAAPEVAAAPGTVSTQSETPAAPEGVAATEEAATAAPDSFTRLDPNTLPPEVRPYYSSMLSDYTRKTQEAAPWRKLGAELGVDSPDSIRDAVELYTRLQDPAALQEFATELNRLLGPAEQPTAATPAPQSEFDLGLGDDPALQTLAQRVDALQQELERRDQMAQQEQMQWALLGEVNRQEALLKEAHPEWGASDGDEVSDEWQAVWNLSVATNGDLVAASRIVEAAQNAALTRMLNSKHEVAHVEGLTPPTPAVVQTPPTVDEEDHELRGPTKAAMEYLRGLVNTSE